MISTESRGDLFRQFRDLYEPLLPAAAPDLLDWLAALSVTAAEVAVGLYSDFDLPPDEASCSQPPQPFPHESDPPLKTDGVNLRCPHCSGLL